MSISRVQQGINFFDESMLPDHECVAIGCQRIMSKESGDARIL
jgi:hypothetical protein